MPVQSKDSTPDKIEDSQKPPSKLHLRYIRLPGQVSDLYDELIFKSKRVIVGRSRITSAHSIVFDGRLVLSAGFQITYFELIGQWFTIGKIRDLEGRHTGYYCDIATPPLVLADSEIEQTDLFLDLWVSPDLRYKVLDENELEDALRKGWVGKELYEAAKSELKRLIQNVQEGRFPPRSVKLLEKKMNL